MPPRKQKPKRAPITVPNPGSADAIAAGCRCAVSDNGYGHGMPGAPPLYFWYQSDCPVHAPLFEEEKGSNA
jgi:hypothetical protein